MKLSLPVLGALCAVATAAPQAQAAAAPSKKTTLTYTATSTVTTRPTLSSGGTTTVSSTTATTYPAPSISLVYDYTTTTTHFDTSYSTIYTTLPAKSTVTVPTPAKFTPLLSESFYTDAVTVVYTTTTVTSPVLLHPASTVTLLYTTRTYTGSTTSTRTTALEVDKNTIVQTTVTRSSSTITSHAACATNNFADKVPTGESINSLEYNTAAYQATLYTDNFPIGASSATDCCEMCFATANCTGGTYFVDGDNFSCELFVLDPSKPMHTCAPATKYQEFEHTQNPYQSANTIFNGGCGQWDWQFKAVDYNKG